MRRLFRWIGATVFAVFGTVLAYSIATEISARLSGGWLKSVAFAVILIFALAINAAVVFTVLTTRTKKHVQ